MLFFPWIGPTTGTARKKPRFISGSISIAAFPRRYSSRTAKGRNGHSSRRFWHRGKRESWIEATRSISYLTPCRQTVNIISAGSNRLREISTNIRNERTMEEDVEKDGVWLYQPSDQVLAGANP